MATVVIVTQEFVDWFSDLTAEEQASVARVVRLLEQHGTALTFPYCSGIHGSRFSGMRELRIQHHGDPYRVLYAFDPVRQAVLLMGGVKTATGNRWYEAAIRLADRLFTEYLQRI